MPDRGASLYCDEDVSVVLAAMLRARGFPVTTARGADRLGEQRFLLLGMSSRHRLLVVAHADRRGSIRIISARRATRRERLAYEEEA